jgi:hypothetical protein
MAFINVEAKVALCESILDYHFQNPRQCIEALFAFPGVCDFQRSRIYVKKNDRLAVLGDIVLNYHLCLPWLASGDSKGIVSILSENNRTATDGTFRSLGL